MELCTADLFTFEGVMDGPPSVPATRNGAQLILCL